MKKLQNIVWVMFLAMAALLLVAAAGVKYVGSFHGDGAGLSNVVSSAQAVSQSLFAWTPITPAGIQTNVHPWVNVREYGANGVYGPDYTTAIQNAIYAATNRGLWTVYIPEGQYRIDSATLDLPFPGDANSVTNQLRIIGANPLTTVLWGVNSQNRPIMKMKGSTNHLGSVRIEGITFAGPAVNWGLTNYPSVAQALATLNRGAVELGESERYEGGRLSMIDVEIINCRFKGSAYGLTITNGQNVVIKNSWFIQNAVHNLVLSHVDTGETDQCNGGRVLSTNRNELSYSVFVCGTPGSSWAGGANADSGVFKRFLAWEHEGPFMYADGARVLVQGGQFENQQATESPLINGWCHLTNYGNYTFRNLTVNMPGTPPANGRTNTILFFTSSGAAGGLRVDGITTHTFNDDSATTAPPRWFRINGTTVDNVLRHPWWSFGAAGSGQDAPTFNNCVWKPNGGSDNYIHIPSQQLGALGVIGPKTNELMRINAGYEEVGGSILGRVFPANSDDYVNITATGQSYIFTGRNGPGYRTNILRWVFASTNTTAVPGTTYRIHQTGPSGSASVLTGTINCPGASVANQVCTALGSLTTYSHESVPQSSTYITIRHSLPNAQIATNHIGLIGVILECYP